MNSFIHKITAAILLFASIIPFALVLSFHIKQKVVHYEMKEKLEEKNLHSVSLAITDVHWVKKNKEILINGKMFDIKSFSVENGFYKFTGLYDDEETALALQLENNFNKNKNTGSWLMSNLFQWLQSVYPGEIDLALITETLQQHNPLFLNTDLTSVYSVILTPPPQHS